MQSLQGTYNQNYYLSSKKQILSPLNFAVKCVIILVYFLLTDCATFVKIGVAKDINLRLRYIQTSCPFQLSVILLLHGSYDEEYSLHTKFKESKKFNEWFYYTEDIKQYVQENKPLSIPVPERKRQLKKYSHNLSLIEDYKAGMPMAALTAKYNRSYQSIDKSMRYYKAKRQVRATKPIETDLFYTCIDKSKLPIYRRQNNGKLYIILKSSNGKEYPRYVESIQTKEGKIAYMYACNVHKYNISSKRARKE